MTTTLPTFEYASDDYIVRTDPAGFELLSTPGPIFATLEWWADVDLESLWATFVRDFRAASEHYWATPSRPEFVEYVTRRVADVGEVDMVWCESCQDPTPTESAISVDNDTAHACPSCYEDDYRSCDDCGRISHYENFTYTLSEESVCTGCSDRHYSFCEDCDGYYHDSESDDHDHRGGCDCAPPSIAVTMRNGEGTLTADERITVGLPAGVISDEGLRLVHNTLRMIPYNMPDGYSEDLYVADPIVRAAAVAVRDAAHADRNKWWTFLDKLPTLGADWQTREGNFTKRLSKLAHKSGGLKIPAEMISKIGNIARDNSKGADVNIEITRDLNQSAEDFYHEDSCWWQSYAESRCSLKNNGGIGLRTFSSHGRVSGRAWIMPLTTNGPSDLNPTFDAVNADAFVVFNGYGDLEGYTAARIVASLNGMSYRKIGFTNSPMYVNGDSGYLVAAEDLLAARNGSRLDLDTDSHSNLFHSEQRVTDDADLATV